MDSVTIAEQISCVDRELGMRSRVYPRWVKNGKLNQAAADLEIKRMEAVRATLVRASAEFAERPPGQLVTGDHLFGPAKVRADERKKVLDELAYLIDAKAMYKLVARLQQKDKRS